jgi:hypothetical protein
VREETAEHQSDLLLAELPALELAPPRGSRRGGAVAAGVSAASLRATRSSLFAFEEKECTFASPLSSKVTLPLLLHGLLEKMHNSRREAKMQLHALVGLSLRLTPTG